MLWVIATIIAFVAVVATALAVERRVEDPREVAERELEALRTAS